MTLRAGKMSKRLIRLGSVAEQKVDKRPQLTFLQSRPPTGQRGTLRRHLWGTPRGTPSSRKARGFRKRSPTHLTNRQLLELQHSPSRGIRQGRWFPSPPGFSWFLRPTTLALSPSSKVSRLLTLHQNQEPPHRSNRASPIDQARG